MSSLPLSTITDTHNRANYIGRCLDALVPEVERIGGEVIVVDNASDDESVAIAQQYPTVNLHINTERRGFSANNNYGAFLPLGQSLLAAPPYGYSCANLFLINIT